MVNIPASVFFYARNPEFIEELRQCHHEMLDEIIKNGIEHIPEECDECLFYFTRYDDMKKLYQSCSIKTDIRIQNNMKRHKDCPLEQKELEDK